MLHSQAHNGDNMALIDCPECGKPLSTTATSCPTCGAAMRKTFPWRWLLGGIAVLLAGWVIASIVAGHRQSLIAENAVRKRLADRNVTGVAFTRYTSSPDHGLEYVCGLATVRQSNDQDVYLAWIVVERGFFPSLVMVTIEGDDGFPAMYLAQCT